MFVLGDDGFPPDDCDGGFEFEDDDEDLTIDIETIYRILDEKPDSAEVSFFGFGISWGSLRIPITRFSNHRLSF